MPSTFCFWDFTFCDFGALCSASTELTLKRIMHVQDFNFSHSCNVFSVACVRLLKYISSFFVCCALTHTHRHNQTHKMKYTTHAYYAYTNETCHTYIPKAYKRVTNVSKWLVWCTNTNVGTKRELICHIHTQKESFLFMRLPDDFSQIIYISTPLQLNK